MAFKRFAEARGGLQSGNGTISTPQSGLFGRAAGDRQPAGDA